MGSSGLDIKRKRRKSARTRNPFSVSWLQYSLNRRFTLLLCHHLSQVDQRLPIFHEPEKSFWESFLQFQDKYTTDLVNVFSFAQHNQFVKDKRYRCTGLLFLQRNKFSSFLGLWITKEPTKVQGPELDLYTHMHTLESVGLCTTACTWGLLSLSQSSGHGLADIPRGVPPKWMHRAIIFDMPEGFPMGPLILTYILFVLTLLNDFIAKRQFLTFHLILNSDPGHKSSSENF